MEFLSANYVNTITQFTVDSNTDSVSKMLSTNYLDQYVTSGYDGSSIATIKVDFDSTVTLNRIVLMNCNFGRFGIYTQPGNSLSYMVLDSDNYVQTWFPSGIGGDDNIYLKTSIDYNVTSLTFEITSTSPTNNEKAIGYIYIGAVDLTMSRPPASKNYKPRRRPKQIVHKMSDGRTRIHRVQKNFELKMKYKYLGASETAALLDIYDSEEAYHMAPFETDSSWDGIFMRPNWTNDWDFDEYSDDSPGTGFSGSMVFTEASD